jgi:phosphoglycerate dehydrogenase-like enzyme
VTYQKPLSGGKGVRAPSFAAMLLLLFHAMILWGNKRFQEALDEADECLRKAPQFRGAEVYRTLALVGFGRLGEAKAQLARTTAPALGVPSPPQSPELASRFLADLKAADWRPAVVTERVAV